ncbi:MAG: beta-glucosidase [Anaeromyxobacter sp.]|nr:beta-glucosidase [Anaeromyxobacter sp.]
MSGQPFPPGFLWGAATSAFQVEGASAEDGRGESIWDRFAARPGAIEDGSDGRRACDHYRRWPEDVALMRAMGLNAYRFSVAWPRVQPLGRGALNAAGLDFYDRLVDGLLEAGLAPMATLYHWDLPQALQDRGGWGARDTAAAFVDYANAVSMRLGDRVRQWVTHNEPWCIAALGHEFGAHAPGARDPALSLQVAHHLLLSHGWAVPVLRRNAPRAEVGIVLIASHAEAETPSPADREAARGFDASFNRWYLDPIFRGAYPADGVADRVRQGHLPGGDLPFVRPGDLAAIATPLDFLGLNYYSRTVLSGVPGPAGEPPPRAVRMAPPEQLTDMGWEVWPQGLEDLLRRLHREYQPARIYITENGAAYGEVPNGDGRVHDRRRSDYLAGHLRAVRRAIAAGVPVGGYFHWSLLDNFEWAHGFTKRFGLVHVDLATMARTPKDSAQYYAAVVAANAVPDDAPHP